MSILENKIKYQMAVKNVEDMKNPVILMNKEDVDNFVIKLENQVDGFMKSDHPTYLGIPIISNENLERSNIVIYDDDNNNKDMPTIKIPSGFITLAKTEFKCPHCEKLFNDRDNKYLNKCNKNKSGITKVTCKCKKEFHVTFNIKGDIVSFIK